MEEPGLDGRHRDQDGTIDRKRRDTRIDTLRDTYGPGFALGWQGGRTLGDLLDGTGMESLSDYLRRHDR
jgi:hypothetical protein